MKAIDYFKPEDVALKMKDDNAIVMTSDDEACEITVMVNWGYIELQAYEVASGFTCEDIESFKESVEDAFSQLKREIKENDEDESIRWNDN